MPNLARCLFLLVLATSSVARASEPLPEESEFTGTRTWVYRCADDVRVVAQVRREEVHIWLPQAGYQVLPQVMALSGNKYQKGDLLLWTKYGEAFMREGDTTYVDCSADHRAAVWEDAKLRGVQYRATGNEPGWFLELNPGQEQLLLVTAYGKQRMSAALPEPEVDSKAKVSRYRTQTDQGALSVTIVAERCQDSMTGEQMESRVTVELGRQTLNGCGRALY